MGKKNKAKQKAISYNEMAFALIKKSNIELLNNIYATNYCKVITLNSRNNGGFLIKLG